jgi:hypothetical protein
MEFEVFQCRREGKLLPRHVMWATKVKGDLFLTEERDGELHRVVRVATVRDSMNKPLIEALHDAVVLSAKPDWWTITGWERVSVSHAEARAYQQSWIMIPADKA